MQTFVPERAASAHHQKADFRSERLLNADQHRESNSLQDVLCSTLWVAIRLLSSSLFVPCQLNILNCRVSLPQARCGCPFGRSPTVLKLPPAVRFVVGVRPVLVRRDVEVEQPHLAGDHPGVGVLERHVPGPERLDLGPLEDDPGLDELEDLVVVEGPAVARDRLDPAL